MSKLLFSTLAASALCVGSWNQVVFAQRQGTRNAVPVVTVVVTPIASNKFDYATQLAQSIRPVAYANVRIAVVDYARIKSTLKASAYPTDEQMPDADAVILGRTLSGDVVLSGNEQDDGMIALTIQTVSTPSFSESIVVSKTELPLINKYFEVVASSIVCLIQSTKSATSMNTPFSVERTETTEAVSVFPDVCMLRTFPSPDSVVAISSRVLRRDPKHRYALEAIARVRDKSLDTLFAPRDEFETTSEYTDRTELANTRLQSAMASISDSIQNEFSRLRKLSRTSVELSTDAFSIGSFDADKELFSIRIGGTNGFFFVPRERAREFRAKMETVKLIANQELNPVSNKIETVFYSVVQVEMSIQSNVTVAQGSVAENQDSALFDYQVDKTAARLPEECNKTGLMRVALGCDAPVRYPEMLLSSGMEGEVVAQFIIDTDGRVELQSFKVIRSSHELFTSEVRKALPKLRYIPAEVGGRKVRQLVQEPFVFNRGR